MKKLTTADMTPNGPTGILQTPMPLVTWKSHSRPRVRRDVDAGDVGQRRDHQVLQQFGDISDVFDKHMNTFAPSVFITEGSLQRQRTQEGPMRARRELQQDPVRGQLRGDSRDSYSQRISQICG
ncbi:hypothetical protein PR003_g12999 [Phytophthora rubi]|uniref:Uncharacterized protein n=1 Tax=Phytophthora rubi TaxID=129364 RepID=A0A6A3IFN9_9STRA|nr:hypothetical protein PR002_g24476 [Phytophthora rubi]KAE9036026.1 hypothetical protein PR001_g9042 [Phytophthora rubi]KAE9335469.1 hypothetical protein PR003_g12999 [Phytophthora rubi]